MQHRDTIEYDGLLFIRYPNAASRHTRVYYWPHDPVTGKRRYDRDALHRELWRAAHGDIPDGHLIHHKDGNPLNNDLGNLECLSYKEHAKEHAVERKEKLRAHAARIRHLASAWHGSEEGRQWHSVLGKLAWAGKKPTTRTCERCGGTCEGFKRRFCVPCEYAKGEAGRKLEHRKCAVCGTGFDVRRDKPQRSCSKKCAWVIRRQG